MDRERLEAYCASKKGATLEYPFGPVEMVFKVRGKMFALISVDNPLRMSLKSDPAWALVLRDTYPAVRPGWFKDTWNSVLVDGSIPDDEILDMVEHSYAQVVKGLTKKERAALDADSGT
jgi:predicted DNA-binding protein (MmcQ/YjbR family)